MFGNRASSLLELEQETAEPRNFYEAVAIVIRSNKMLEYAVQGTIVCGNQHLVSVGALDAMHYRVPDIARRLLHTYGGAKAFVTVCAGEKRTFDDPDWGPKSIEKYLKWSGSHEERNFDTHSWQVTLHRS